MSTLAVKKVKLGDNADPSKNFLIEVPAVADGTLTIKRENGTNVLSIDANGKAVIPGVVGTVAQVGGVPTGQVVERGSNANGEYVRFADGTQICTKTIAPSPLTWQTEPAITGVKAFLAFGGAFAASFVSVHSRGGNMHSYYALGLDETTLTSFGAIRVQTTITSALDPAAMSTVVQLYAIGRWY